MRRGHYIAALALLLAVFSLSFASTALADHGTPQDICHDLQDNGVLDGHYTAEELTAFVNDPTAQGYCGPIAETVSPVVTSHSVKGPQTTHVKGVRHSVASPTRSAVPLGTSKTTGSLPFTGAELALFALVGLALIGTGLLLRTTARQRS
jgi:hypothetical protein